jgi:hypothetical protein
MGQVSGNLRLNQVVNWLRNTSPLGELLSAFYRDVKGRMYSWYHKALDAAAMGHVTLNPEVMYLGCSAPAAVRVPLGESCPNATPPR